MIYPNRRLDQISHCRTLVSWRHRLQPQLSWLHAVLLLKSSKSTTTIIDSLFSPITLLNKVSCAFRVCMSLLGFMLHFCMHAILIYVDFNTEEIRPACSACFRIWNLMALLLRWWLNNIELMYLSAPSAISPRLFPFCKDEFFMQLWSSQQITIGLNC